LLAIIASILRCRLNVKWRLVSRLTWIHIIWLLGPSRLEMLLRHKWGVLSLERPLMTIRIVGMGEFSLFHGWETHLLLVKSPLFLHEVLTIRPLGWVIRRSEHWVLHLWNIRSFSDHLCGPHLSWFVYVFIFGHQRRVVKSLW